MQILIGIDDTDNLYSRGTGFRARELGGLLATEVLAEVRGITRHQLLFDRRIPYTSHNSSLCLSAEIKTGRMIDVIDFCGNYLERKSAPGSDAGLCVAERQRVQSAIQTYGARAKLEILDQRSANDLAESEGIALRGLTGDHGGVIGALAAIGLHASGCDGRFVWLRGLRGLSGLMTAAALNQSTGIDEIRPLHGGSVGDSDRIDTSPWPRPVLLEGRAVLLVVEVEEDDESVDWRLAPKEIVKRY